MSGTPQVSVVIATYNRSAALAFAVRSVLRQSFTEFECLIVGDGCTDDTDAVVAGFADARVRWLPLERNSGHQSTPNNAGIAAARGEFVAYLGHDDLWLPHHLEVLVRALRDGADFVVDLVLMVHADEEHREFAPVTAGRYRRGDGIPPSCVAHTRSIVERVGGWRDFEELGSLHPDRELWSRMSDAGASPRFVPRLGAIKFPAVWRKNVYVGNVAHEQQRWSARIENEGDLETRELALLVAGSNDSRLISAESFADLARRLGREMLRRSMRRLRRGLNPRDWRDGIEDVRTFKGLPRRRG